MKLLKITTNYPAYLNKFYAKRPGLEQSPYIEQKAALDHDAFGWADFWENALRPLGYDVVEIIANVEPAQKAWAREHGLPFRESNWLLEIVKAQVEEESPDVLFVDDYSSFPYKWLAELRNSCTSIKLMLGWCGAPFVDATVFKAYDVVLSCIPELVESFREMGHRSEHINHAFDPRIIERIDLEVEPYIDFSFIGSIFRNNRFHLERERMLERIVRLGNIEIFSSGAEMTHVDDLKTIAKQGLYGVMGGLLAIGVSKEILKTIPVVGKAADWESMPLRPVNPRLKPYMKPAVFGLEMFQTLRNSRTTLNSHVDISPRSASNMRLFEATGVGTCLVTDWKENLHELFEPEKEVVTFRSTEECVEKVNWLLEHPKEREEIAKAGQARCLRDHTYAQRALRLNEIIKREMA
jgi:spore maturation protein CgeB